MKIDYVQTSDTMKMILKGKFIEYWMPTSKIELCYNNNLQTYLKALEHEGRNNKNPVWNQLNRNNN